MTNQKLLNEFREALIKAESRNHVFTQCLSLLKANLPFGAAGIAQLETNEAKRPELSKIYNLASLILQQSERSNNL